MIAITEHAAGFILSVRAQPGARKAGVLGIHAGALKIAVTAPPQDGRANKALIELLAETLDLRRSQVHLLSGETRRDKRFLIQGVSQALLKKKLAAVMSELT